jgi:hypothetical protein
MSSPGKKIGTVNVSGKLAIYGHQNESDLALSWSSLKPSFIAHSSSVKMIELIPCLNLQIEIPLYISKRGVVVKMAHFSIRKLNNIVASVTHRLSRNTIIRKP